MRLREATILTSVLATLALANGPAAAIDVSIGGAGVSAGGMPDRVKCLHALVGHALAAGPGVNPLGDAALADIGAFWASPCRADVR